MTIATVRVGEVSLAYEARGRGSPIVLVAGGFMNMDLWDAQMAMLSATHQVVRFDLRGVGASDKPTRGYNIEQLAADTAQLIATLNLAPGVIFGSSLGGMIAIETALQAPSLVSALILAGTSAGARGIPTPRATQEEMFAGALMHSTEESTEALYRVLFHSDYPQHHPALIEQAIAKRRAYPPPPVAMMQPLQSAAIYDPLDRLRNLQIPTLVLHGAEDRLVPADNSRLLAETIPGAQCHVIEDAGHAVVLEAAESVSSAVEAFLTAL